MVNVLAALVFVGIGFWLGYLKGAKTIAQKVMEDAKAVAALYRPALNPDYQYVVTETRVAFEQGMGLEPDPNELLFRKAAAEYHQRQKNGVITEREENDALRCAHLILEKTVLANRLRELKERFTKDNIEAAWDLGA